MNFIVVIFWFFSWVGVGKRGGCLRGYKVWVDINVWMRWLEGELFRLFMVVILVFNVYIWYVFNWFNFLEISSILMELENDLDEI